MPLRRAAFFFFSLVDLPPLRPMTAAALLISDVLMDGVYTAWLASGKRFGIMGRMSLFTPAVSLEFTADEWRILHRPIIAKQDGGFQSLLRRLLADADWMHLTIEDADLQRCYRYGYDTQSGGGYEDRFKAIIRAALRAGWVPA